jgi:hypothetical protein
MNRCYYCGAPAACTVVVTKENYVELTRERAAERYESQRYDDTLLLVCDVHHASHEARARANIEVGEAYRYMQAVSDDARSCNCDIDQAFALYREVLVKRDRETPRNRKTT